MTPRDRRAVAVGGTVVLAAVLVLRVLPWAIGRAFATEQQLIDRAGVLARARADLVDAAGLRDSAAELAQAVVGLAPKLLSGSSPAEARADLSGRINLAASRSAAKLERVEELPDTAVAGWLCRVRLRATLESDIRGFAGVLQGMERGEAALVVSELHVAALDPGSPNRAPEVLRVELTVVGWFLGPPVNARTKDST